METRPSKPRTFAKLASHAAPHALAHIDLYARLGLSSSASGADIKIAYRALILRLHPDRNAHPAGQELVNEGVTAEEINEAWEVLGDGDRRQTYDAARRAHLAASRPQAHAYAVSLSLDLFEPHFVSSTSAFPSGTADDSEPEFYTHTCRCSSQFKITREQLEAGVEVVGCEGCSERCRVEYEVVEDEA
ncbi:hypothetical protein JCM21900_000219 [Sporobolomyces salmonicolor]